MKSRTAKRGEICYLDILTVDTQTQEKRKRSMGQ